MTSTTPPPMPFSESQWQQVQQLLRTLDQRQAYWLSGYLAAEHVTPSATAATAPGKAVLIAHGGETGNSESVAHALAAQARAAGVAVDVADLANLRVRQLNKREYLLLICSTHGDGDPPEPAIPFYEALMAEDAPALKQLQYAVLALGDSTYEHFCATGVELDQRLATLGGTRLQERVDCDVDFDEPAARWSDAVLSRVPRGDAAAQAQPAGVGAEQQQSYGKKSPATAEVLENLNLSASERASPIHHLELALEAPGFQIEAGDAVGVLADNPPALVAAVLDACQLSGEAPVTVAEQSLPLVQALRQHRDLTIPGTRLLEFWAQLSGDGELTERAAAPAREQRQYLKQVQVLDLLTRAAASPEPQALIDALRPLQPRLYDVANSRGVIDDELHLNVKDFRYPFAGRTETGIASHYLLTLEPGDTVQVYPHRNARFHLPDDTDSPLILIAEGTGIAPYRAFLQELEHRQSQRPCWLVFAEQRFEEDFLYQSELQQARDRGVLDRVDAVFYADSPGHTLATPLLQQPALLQGKLEDGAHVYFCGDKARLTECETALADQLGVDAWQALGKAGRLHRNLY